MMDRRTDPLDRGAILALVHSYAARFVPSRLAIPIGKGNATIRRLAKAGTGPALVRDSLAAILMAEPAFQSRAAAWAARIILALASLSVALLVAEIGLRWILPPAQVPLGPHPGFLTHDATLGWVPVPGGNGTMGGEEFSVAVSINDQGFRGPRTYPRARLPGIPRVVVVGDSFSFGYGVRHEENWITRIEHALAPAEVINLAVTGYGTDQQLLASKPSGSNGNRISWLSRCSKAMSFATRDGNRWDTPSRDSSSTATTS